EPPRHRFAAKPEARPHHRHHGTPETKEQPHLRLHETPEILHAKPHPTCTRHRRQVLQYSNNRKRRILTRWPKVNCHLNPYGPTKRWTVAGQIDSLESRRRRIHHREFESNSPFWFQAYPDAHKHDPITSRHWHQS